MSFFELPGSKPVYKVEVRTGRIAGPHHVAAVSLYFLSPPTVEGVVEAIAQENAASRKGGDYFPRTKAEVRTYDRAAKMCQDFVRKHGIPKLSGKDSSRITEHHGVVGKKKGDKRPLSKADMGKIASVSVGRVWAKP